MKKITIGIDGMMCAMCESHINETIRSHFNVKKVNSSRTKKNSVILSDEAISEESLRKVIDPTGYTMTGYQIEDVKKKGLFGF